MSGLNAKRNYDEDEGSSGLNFSNKKESRRFAGAFRQTRGLPLNWLGPVYDKLCAHIRPWSGFQGITLRYLP